MNSDFRRLADERLGDAKVLLDAGQWSGAYYLAGYSVECALKARIFRDVRRYASPDKKIVNDSWTHNILKLVELAGLMPEVSAEMRAGSRVGINWLLVKDWTEEARYSSWSESDAREMLRAISERGSGVLRWIKTRW